MLKHRYILVLLLFFGFITYASANTNTEADKAAVQQAYIDWCNAISKAKGNASVMVKFYAPDAILLPTFYPKILMNRNGGLNDYFKNFTAQSNLKCIPIKLMTQLYDDVAINSGFYTFTYTDADGSPVTVPARFTIVYELKNKQWLIIEHHSSMKPPR